MELSFNQIHAYWEHRHPGQRIGTQSKIAVRCAFHDDHAPSCTIYTDGNGGFHCHGCGAKGNLFQFEARFSKCDLQQAEINVATITGAKPTPRWEGEVNLGPPTDIYDYRDESGQVLFQKRRYKPNKGGKTFRSFHMTEKGWKACIDPKDGERTRRVLFNLPDVVKANLVFVVEGEKCVLALMNADLFASAGYSIAVTTSFDGAWKPREKPKWLDSYNPYFAGKLVVLFSDNDEPGREYVEHVARSIAALAFEVRTVVLPGLEEGGDVSDWLKTHTTRELEAEVKLAPAWTPPVQSHDAGMAQPWAAEGMEMFLGETEEDVEWLVPHVLAPGRLTEIFAPRGIGKSLLADNWAVQAAKSGKRVLILDRDNNRRTLQTRLRGFGAEGLELLKAIDRENCPPLTQPEKWAAFPYLNYDLVVVDSIDAMAEGVGEQDSSKPARAMAPLLDICHRKNGPGVLLLGNTVKTAEHSRGSGVVEDRADIVYEVRDGTDFHPTGQKPWIEELPAQGAKEWAARSARRKGKTRLRLALVPTKFRDGEEPPPRMLEICMEDTPWTVEDVTASVDADGEAERAEVAAEKASKATEGLKLLLDTIDSLKANGQAPLLKTAAEEFLTGVGYTRKIARDIIADDSIAAVPGRGKGHPMELHRKRNEVTAELANASSPNSDAGMGEGDFCRPQLTGTATIDGSESSINEGVLLPSISAAELPIDAEGGLVAPQGPPGSDGFFELEV